MLWVLYGAIYVLAAVILDPPHIIAIPLSIAGVILGLKEMKRWQAGSARVLQLADSRAGEPRTIYPRWAWFASGAVPSEVIGGPIAENATGPGVWLLPSIAFVAGGIAMQSLMVARANHRNDAVAKATLSMVPPTPLPPPRATIPCDGGRADHGGRELKRFDRSGAGRRSSTESTWW